MKKRRQDFQIVDHGTTLSTSNQTLFQNIVQFIPSRYRNKKNFKSLLTIISKKATSDPRNLPWPLLFSSWIKRMENYDLVKITNYLMKEPSKMPIHSRSFRNLLIN